MPWAYHYCSDAKVDMLLGQLPHKLLESAALELKLNIKDVLKADVRTAVEFRSHRRFDRLHTVIRALELKKPSGDESVQSWSRVTGPYFLWEHEDWLLLTNELRLAKRKEIYVGSKQYAERHENLLKENPQGLASTLSPVVALGERILDAFEKVAREATDLPDYLNSELRLPKYRVKIEFMALKYVDEEDLVIGSPLYIRSP